MFNTIEEAVAFAEKKENDGGRPRFYVKAVHYKDYEGNVNARDEIWVEIHNVGDPKNIQDRPKREEDEKRWPEYWKAYKDNTEVPTDGTPISSFPLLTPADIENLGRRKIKTVEELINLPDQELTNVLGGKGFGTKKKAQEFLAYRDKSEDIPALLKRIEELEKLVGDNTANSEQRADGDGVHVGVDADSKRKPGRKKAAGARKKVRKKAS